MFTGLIQCLGKIQSKQRQQQDCFFDIQVNPSFLEEVKIGDSISINGACQTVVSFTKDSFKVYSALATLQLTNFGSLKKGDKVNLEKALRTSDRLHGHIVYGHVEGVGKIQSIHKKSHTTLIKIQYPLSLEKAIFPQGSIAINGISLTIYEKESSCFVVSVIPETIKNTTLQFSQIGNLLNLETDILLKQKSCEKILFFNSQASDHRLKKALIKKGFIQE